MRTSTLRNTRDKPRVALSISTPSAGKPVDLLQTANTWIFRAYRDGASIKVARTLNAGASWGEPVTLVTDASTDEDTGAAPTLCRTARDELFCWYHTDANEAKAYLSLDYGRTWTLFATVAGLIYPRALIQSQGTWLAGIVGDELRIYTSPDFGTSRTLQHTISGVQAARPELRTDRRGLLHLVCRSDGDYVHRWYPDDLGANAGWSAPETLQAAEFAVYVVGLERAFLAGFTADTDTMVALVTAPTHRAKLRDTGTPSGTWAAQYLGALWSHREQLCLVGSQGEELVTRWSGDTGRTWGEP